jgi:hypothetical protein
MFGAVDVKAVGCAFVYPVCLRTRSQTGKLSKITKATVDLLACIASDTRQTVRSLA